MERQIKLLIAEDNDHVRETIMTGTRSQGYVYEIAEDGWEALKLIQSDSFDTIILDVGLPGLNGLEVLQKARDQNLDIAPVIIVTGFPQKAHKERAVKLGAIDYLTKAPLSLEELIAAITRATAARDDHHGK